MHYSFLFFIACILFAGSNMSFKSKRSKSAVESAGKKWARNLKTITKRRPSIPEMKDDINEILCKMPLNRNIVGRFLGLYDELKGRADRIKKISQELLKLWEKLSFPILSKQQVSAKVDKLIKGFEKYRKRQNKEFEKNLTYLFNITNRVETGCAVKTRNFTENKLNQEVEWDTRLRKWLICQRFILRNGQETHQNRQQAKYKS